MKRLYFILIFSYLISHDCLSQELIHLEGIEGQWIISNDITPTEARAKALDEAKANALRAAGVPEVIAQSDINYVTEEQGQIQNVFNSMSSIGISGELRSIKLVDEIKTQDSLGNFVISVFINASVVVHENQEDYEFNIKVDGLKDSYLSNEELKFTVTATQDGYLNVFVIDEQEAAIIYPNKFEKKLRLEAGKETPFPRSSAIKYNVTTDDKIDVNWIVLIYTKENTNFREKLNLDELFEFVSNIDNYKKRVKTHSFSIKRNK